jgi:hypothetical protein
MKKLIITSLLAVAPFLGFAQTKAFDKFQNVEGIESVCISKKFFEMAGGIEASGSTEKTKKCLDMVKNIDNLKIFTTSERRHKKDLSQAVASYLKETALTQLLAVNDKESKVKVFVKEGGKATEIREALLFVENDKEVVVMSFTGAVDLNDIKALK